MLMFIANPNNLLKFFYNYKDPTAFDSYDTLLKVFYL